MSAVDLLLARAELDRQTQVPSRQWLDFVRSNALDLDEVRAHAGMVVTTSATFDGERFNLVGAAGEPSVIIEALDKDGVTILDLVGWPISAPERFATFAGRAALLGVAAAFNPATYVFGRPLRIHRHPLSWLRAACDGAVVLDERQASRILIDARGDMQFEDSEHAASIARAMSDLLPLHRFLAPKRSAA